MQVDPVCQAVSMLMNNVDGALVKEWFRTAFTDEKRTNQRSLSTMDSEIYRIRLQVMAHDYRHPDYNDCELRQFDCDEIKAFLDADLHTQVKTQDSHRKEPTWEAPAEKALAAMKLLPDNMAGFRPSQHEALQLKRQKEANLILKNEKLLVIPDACALLKFAIGLVRTARCTHSYPRLIAPLLLLSGRRLAEICNGRSTFESVDSGTRCVFTGQLKTKSNESRPYVIPLLCDFQDFINGMDALREKQGEMHLTEKQVTTRYASNLKSSNVFGSLVPKCKTHDLRSIFAAYVSHLYVSAKYSIPRVTMAVCGHQSLSESLHYANVRLDHTEDINDSYGPLLPTDHTDY